MKKKLFLTILILGIALVTTPFSVAAANDNSQKMQGYISLNNSITKEVEPNIALITFSVENTSDSAEKAVLDNNTTSAKIIEALKLISNNESDIIKTSNFSVNPVYTTTSSGKRTIKNYVAVNSVNVQTKDITKVAKLIDTAIANGANRTDNLMFSIEDNKSICKEQYPLLIKDLKDTADVLAKSIGTSVSGLKYLNVSCNTENIASNGRFYAKSNMAMDSVSSESTISTPIESGKVKIRIYVNADFYVK